MSIVCLFVMCMYYFYCDSISFFWTVGLYILKKKKEYLNDLSWCNELVSWLMTKE